MKIILILFCLILSPTCDGAQSNSSSIWDSFLLKPENDSLRQINAVISNSPKHCNQEKLPNTVQLAKLITLIQKGNQSALRAGLLISKCIGVGDLEDFYRSTGLFFEMRPQMFLKIAKENVIADREIGYMVTMLPLDLVDNVDGKITTVNNRITILNRIADASLIKIKKIVSAYLEKEKFDLERIKSDQEP